MATGADYSYFGRRFGLRHILQGLVMASPQIVGALAATATLLRSGPVRLMGIHSYNISSALVFVQCFNAATAASVTPGTTAPDASFGYTNGTQLQAELGLEGIYFGKGLVVCATTTYNGNTVPATSNSVPVTFDIQ
jgi:hypothetical protein